jgi:hypothetical protein
MVSCRNLITRTPATFQLQIPVQMKDRPFSALLVLSMTLLVAPIGILGAESRSPAKAERSLELNLQTIKETFRSQRSEFLKPVLPKSGKVYLNAKVLAHEPGYYSPDQLLALFSQTLSRLKTQKFQLEPPVSQEGELRVALCPAFWRYLKQGESKRARLQFIFTRRGERWTLSEIREIR